MTDTNVLVRCSQGRAMDRVYDLHRRNVRLVTTSENARELHRKLVDVFKLDHTDAADEAERVVAFFDLIGTEAFEHLRPQAEARLSKAGKSDWPALAAAMAFEGGIWSDDRDYFGVGVPIWSSGNILFAEPEQ